MHEITIDPNTPTPPCPVLDQADFISCFAPRAAAVFLEHVAGDTAHAMITVPLGGDTP